MQQSCENIVPSAKVASLCSTPKTMGFFLTYAKPFLPSIPLTELGHEILPLVRTKLSALYGWTEDNPIENDLLRKAWDHLLFHCCPPKIHSILGSLLFPFWKGIIVSVIMTLLAMKVFHEPSVLQKVYNQYKYNHSHTCGFYTHWRCEVCLWDPHVVFVAVPKLFILYAKELS